MEKVHIAALATKHAGLEARIEEEHRHRHADDLAIVALKKAKLRLKDEIESG